MLAVNQIAATAWGFGGCICAGAIALLANHKQERDAANTLRDQCLRGVNHGRDDALRIASSTAPDEFSILARRIERRHGIDMGGERDHRVAPVREQIETMRFHFESLDASAGACSDLA